MKPRRFKAQAEWRGSRLLESLEVNQADFRGRDKAMTKQIRSEPAGGRAEGVRGVGVGCITKGATPSNRRARALAGAATGRLRMTSLTRTTSRDGWRIRPGKGNKALGSEGKRTNRWAYFLGKEKDIEKKGSRIGSKVPRNTNSSSQH